MLFIDGFNLAIPSLIPSQEKNFDKINFRKVVKVSYRGKCCSDRCSDKWDPVCDNRGVTHEAFDSFFLQA